MNAFEREVSERLDLNAADKMLQAAARGFLTASIASKYSYNFSWLGRPIIQYPQDIAAIQEIIWSTRPDVIVETGIAHGGSLVFTASMLALLDLCDAASSGLLVDPRKPRRRVVGVDIDIRPHNREAIEAHPLANRIAMVQGSSIDLGVIDQVRAFVGEGRRVMVCLDSMHTHEHVLAELHAYAPMVTPECYCVVFDTVVEDLPKDAFADRPWGPGDNPKSAVHEFLKGCADFQIDASIHNKLQITVAPDGYLKRIA